MWPVLLTADVAGRPFVLHAYGTLYALGLAAAVAAGTIAAGRRGMPWRRALAVYALAAAAGLVGARLFDLFVAGGLYAAEPERLWSLRFQGFSLYGGLAAAALAGAVLARVLRLPLWRLADTAVPALAAGIVLMRAGCFMQGCCFGIETDVPWAVTYPAGSPAWAEQGLRGSTGILAGLMGGAVHPTHPTQLYELAAVALLAAGALLLARRGVPDGVPLLAFALGFTAFRLGNGFLRARPNTITAPEWFYPALYLSLIGVLAVLLVRRLRASCETAA